MKTIIPIFLCTSLLGVQALDYSRLALRNFKSHPLVRRRLDQEHNSAASSLTTLPDCPGEICARLAGEAIAPLLAAAPICAQQEMAEKMIDAAKDMSNKIGSQATRDKMIKIAQEYRKAERNTHPIYFPGPVGRNSVYCQKEAKYPELKGLVQAQDTLHNHPLLFFDPLVKTNGSTVLLGSQPNTFPFGTQHGDTKIDPESKSSATLNSIDTPTGGSSSTSDSTATSGTSKTPSAPDHTTGTNDNTLASTTTQPGTPTAGSNSTLDSTGTESGVSNSPSAPGPSSGTTDNTLDSTKSQAVDPKSPDLTNTGTGASDKTSQPTETDLSEDSCDDEGTPGENLDSTAGADPSSTSTGDEISTPSTNTGANDSNPSGSTTSISADNADNKGASPDPGNTTLASVSSNPSTADPSSSTSDPSDSTGEELVLDVNTIPNKECRDMRIEFGLGLPTRKPKEAAYQPLNFKVHKHTPALNIQIITQFLCDDLRNTCGVKNITQFNSCKALSDKIGPGKAIGAKADQWNKGFGFKTEYFKVKVNDTTPGGPGSGQPGGGTGGAGSGQVGGGTGGAGSSQPGGGTGGTGSGQPGGGTGGAGSGQPASGSQSVTAGTTSTSDPSLTSTAQPTTTPLDSSKGSTLSTVGTTGGGVIDVSKIPKEECRDMRIEFGSGFPGREPNETTYEPFNSAVHKHGAAIGITNILIFMCDELVNTCGLHQEDKIFTDCKALVAAIGAAKGSGAAADKWNAGFGFTTDYATHPAVGVGTGGKPDGVTHPGVSASSSTNTPPPQPNAQLNAISTDTNQPTNNMDTNSMNNNNMMTNTNMMNNNNMNMNTNPPNNNPPSTNPSGNSLLNVNGTGSSGST